MKLSVFSILFCMFLSQVSLAGASFDLSQLALSGKTGSGKMTFKQGMDTIAKPFSCLIQEENSTNTLLIRNASTNTTLGVFNGNNLMTTQQEGNAFHLYTTPSEDRILCRVYGGAKDVIRELEVANKKVVLKVSFRCGSNMYKVLNVYECQF